MRAMLAAARCGKGDVEANLAGHLRLLRSAAGAGCDLVLFPEMSLSGSVDPASQPERLIRLDHPAVAALAEASGDTGVGVCFGIAERSPSGDPHITQVFAAGGRVAGVQRKRHLWPGEEPFTAAGESHVFEHAGTRFGVAICYEAGFDGPFDAAHAGGAGLVLFPAAPGLYGRRTDKESWRVGYSWWHDCALGLISFHASESGLIPVGAIPVLYAAAMASGALAALGSGHLYDRHGARVLFALPALGLFVPALALSGRGAAIVVGSLLWGAAAGVQDSTVKALVADLVPAPRRATAYGVFAAIQGAAALAGGILAGGLYQHSRPLLGGRARGGAFVPREQGKAHRTGFGSWMNVVARATTIIQDRALAPQTVRAGAASGARVVDIHLTKRFQGAYPPPEHV
jgi:hypothetical protein